MTRLQVSVVGRVHMGQLGVAKFLLHCRIGAQIAARNSDEKLPDVFHVYFQCEGM